MAKRWRFMNVREADFGESVKNLHRAMIRPGSAQEQSSKTALKTSAALYNLPAKV
jgi:hypothetical protein